MKRFNGGTAPHLYLLREQQRRRREKIRKWVGRGIALVAGLVIGWTGYSVFMWWVRWGQEVGLLR